MKKRILSIALVLILGITISGATTRATSKTRDEALAWVRAQVGRSIDTDGYPAGQPYQCVDLIKAYYQFLGETSPGGNGADYATNALPAGWNRIQGAQPEPGDILVYTGGAGHVAIYESDRCHYHQNFANNPKVEKITYMYNGLSNPYWGVIRPNWGGSGGGNNPQGCIDQVTGEAGRVFVGGWAFDRDNTNESIDLHVYIGGDAASGEGHAIHADKARQDVNDAYQISGNHAFSDYISTNKRGTQDVYIYLINIGGGDNVLLGKHTANISEPAPTVTTAPTTAPTATPVVKPSAVPTVSPSAGPTVRPSVAPTAEPTAVPVQTVKPSVAPTAAPTYAPSTPVPTVAPTASTFSVDTPSFYLSAKKRGFQVTINGDSGASHEIQFSRKRSMSGASKSYSSGKTKKISWLKRKKWYYVRVRSYIWNDGGYVYSKWSSVKAVKTK